jgi:hypothetical protein
LTFLNIAGQSGLPTNKPLTPLISTIIYCGERSSQTNEKAVINLQMLVEILE